MEVLLRSNMVLSGRQDWRTGCSIYWLPSRHRLLLRPIVGVVDWQGGMLGGGVFGLVDGQFEKELYIIQIFERCRSLWLNRDMDYFLASKGLEELKRGRRQISKEQYFCSHRVKTSIFWRYGSWQSRRDGILCPRCLAMQLFDISISVLTTPQPRLAYRRECLRLYTAKTEVILQFRACDHGRSQALYEKWF